MKNPNQINKLRKLLNKGLNNTKKAGRLYAEMVARDPDVTVQILQRDPSLTREDMDWFQRVGLGQVPDAEILERGVKLAERIQNIDFN